MNWFHSVEPSRLLDAIRRQHISKQKYAQSDIGQQVDDDASVVISVDRWSLSQCELVIYRKLIGYNFCFGFNYDYKKS